MANNEQQQNFVDYPMDPEILEEEKKRAESLPQLES